MLKWLFLALTACGFPRPDLHDLDAGTDADVPAVACDECRLLALAPSIAKAGDTITLEGTFVPGAKARFPGGDEVELTLLGSHRATAVVPESATTGALAVVAGSSTTSALAFRRVTFDPGLVQVQRFETQSGGARTMPQHVTGRRYAAAVSTGSHLHVIGGAGGIGLERSVETARIGSSGLERLVTATATLVTPRMYAVAVATDRFVYVVGGSIADPSGDLPIASVERAPIEPDGTLGAFVIAGNLTTARLQATAEVIGDSLYVLGGFGAGGEPLASIERATISADGSLGAFADAGVSLAKGRNAHQSAVIDSQLYVLGGQDTDGALEGTIERASIQTDGSLGAFEVVPGATLQSLNAAIGHALVLGDAIYIPEDQTLDGSGSAHPIEIAPITAGELGALSVSDQLSTRTCCYAAVPAGNQVYFVGGADDVSVTASRSIRGSIQRSGALAKATAAVQQTHGGRGFGVAAVVGDRLYEIGGFDGASLATIQEAQIGGGELGAFSASPRTLNTARHRAAIAVIGNSVFVIGGSNRMTPTSGTTGLASIERADLQPDGSLGAFSMSGQLTSARSSHSAIALGGFLYVLGGGVTSVERAPITNGSLGAFAVVPGVTTQGRSMTGVAVIRDFVYLFGGGEGASALSSIERAPIAADGTLGTFSAVGSQLTTPRGAPTIAVIGDAVFVIGGVNQTGVLASVERAQINPDGSLSSFAVVPGVTLIVARVAQTAAIVGNALWVVGGDFNGVAVPATVERMELR